MMRILLDNGHGSQTAGKRSPVWPDGAQLFEWELNRDIVRRLAALLSRSGVPHDVLVGEDVDVPLAERVRRANEICRREGAQHCLLVSVHANAGGGTGWEVFTSKGQTAADRYAEIFCQWAEMALPEFRLRTDLSDGDRDKEASLYILSKSACPAVLTENLFMDTERDCRFLLSDAGRKRIARMHYDAILECIAWHDKNVGR